MSFNPGLCKQAQEVIFTCNFNKAVHPPVSYNNNPVQQVSTQKRSVPILDASLTFDELIKAIASKVKPLVCCGNWIFVYHGSLLLQFIIFLWGLI